MAESLMLSSGVDKETRYKELIPQIQALVDGEEDLVANLSNITAALKEAFGFFWVGFYLVKGNQLVLGPFQGPIACTRIQSGKGVCGKSWSENRTYLVPDVDQFPGHIACSSASRSEIVLPLHNLKGEVVGVLDVDSDQLDDFDSTDQRFLEELCHKIRPIFG